MNCIIWCDDTYLVSVWNGWYYEGCLESIQPLWIYWEPVTCPWCNLVASQRRPYYSSVNSHSPVGLVSRQWDAVDWACVPCDHHIHNDRASRSASSPQCACPFYSSCVGFFGTASRHPGLSAPLQPRFDSLWLLAFPKSKIAVERLENRECDRHTVHKLSQWHLIVYLLAPRESDCSQMRSKVSSVTFNRTQSRAVTGLLMGHNTLRRHLHLLGLLDSPLCRKCRVGEETSAHILCQREALASLRHAYLGSFSLEPEDFRSLGLGAIWSYSKAAGLSWFDMGHKGPVLIKA